MLTLNLIPQQFKRELALHSVYVVLKKFFILLFAVLLMCSVSLIFARIYLKEKLHELTLQAQAISFRTHDIKEKVTTLNTLLKKTRSSLESTQAWAPVLTALYERIPSDITVNDITLTSEKQLYRIQIEGTSPSRDAYLEFEQSIKKLPFIKTFTSPIQNILSTGENSFSLTLLITPLPLQ